MRKLARRVGIALAVLEIAFVVAVLATARRGDAALFPPAPSAPRVQILLVHNGYHTGLVLPRAALAEVAGRRGHGALIAVATRFAAFAWVEIGWGDEQFYRHVPTPASLSVGLALHALFGTDNASVLHVVGVTQPHAAFAQAELGALDLSAEGFERLLAGVEATFWRDGRGLPEDLGPGLYGPSLFYRATGRFHALHVCSHWVADMLDAAGVPTAPVLATLPQGLFLDLSWRAGMTVPPRSQ
jgi:uncharacterized protein (TIGR02117 family)